MREATRAQPGTKWGKVRRARRLVPPTACAAVLALYANTAPAQVVLNFSTWKGGNGTWGTAANWDPSGVPNNNLVNHYDVTIPSGTVTLNINPTILGLAFNGGSMGIAGRTLTVNDRINWGSGVFAGAGNVIANNGINM